jgi:hypothetical protein
MSRGQSRDLGPPDWEGEGAHTPASARHHHHQITGHHPGMFDSTARRPHLGRCAHAWREGFGAGFRDALRLAAREIDDPHAWAMLDRLADRYRSDHGLCGSDG